MAINVIEVTFEEGERTAYAEMLTQWDHGQILHINGLDLPSAFEIHFSNDKEDGKAKPRIGADDTVEIPSEYLKPGETVYAWIYQHEGDADGKTTHTIIIPLGKRSQPVDIEPDPEEQTVIEGIIDDMNAAAAKAEEAIEHYPYIGENGNWYRWDVTTGAYVDTGDPAQGDPGTSPTITVTDITGGHKVSITDGSGTVEFNVMDGAQGDPGDDGVSPSVTVTEIIGGHRVAITDKNGTHTIDVMDGTKGDPGNPGSTGNGIASIVKTGTSGLVDTYTITYTNGQTTTFTVTNGAQGDPGDDYVLTASDKTDIAGIVRSAFRVEVDGTDPVINAQDNYLYVCGTLSTLTINAPAIGEFAVRFTSGTSATVFRADNVVWEEYFDPTELETNAQYEISISDRLGVFGQWPI